MRKYTRTWRALPAPVASFHLIGACPTRPLAPRTAAGCPLARGQLLCTMGSSKVYLSPPDDAAAAPATDASSSAPAEGAAPNDQMQAFFRLCSGQRKLVGGAETVERASLTTEELIYRQTARRRKMAAKAEAARRRVAIRGSRRTGCQATADRGAAAARPGHEPRAMGNGPRARRR